MKTEKVTIIMPIYNESLAIQEILRRVFRARLPEGFDKEVVIVDDGSTDSTLKLVDEFLSEHPEHHSAVRVYSGLINHGKSAALRAGFRLATGSIILIQDGDLEYSPDDYAKLIEPFRNSETQVVYGSRFVNGFPEGMRWLNLVANLILTGTTRVLFGQPITDEATCYKVFRRSLLSRMHLQSRGFEFCPEFTGKALMLGAKILEVPISYSARGLMDGKKIRAKDGFIALWWLFKVRFSWKPLPAPAHKVDDTVDRKVIEKYATVGRN